jgi:hypothetical protein
MVDWLVEAVGESCMLFLDFVLYIGVLSRVTVEALLAPSMKVVATTGG